jgi:tripartite-type tricarboxylate transporter receptor subunit TctC
MHHYLTLTLCALASMLSPLLFAQQPYPSKPLRLIVPFPPGGGNDTVARLVGQRLSERLAQPVLIDNRGGAGGNIGMELAAKAPADGYSLALGSLTTLVINPNVYKGLSFNTTRDFAPVTQLVSSSLVLVIHPTVPAKSVKQLIALAKSQPGRLNYAAGSTAGHLAGELFKMTGGLDIVHIPYKGNAQALTDVMSGQVALLFAGVLAAQPHVKTGRVRALAVTGSRRSPTMRDLPTVAEAGLPGFEVDSWYGILAPANIPRAVIERLNKELVVIVQADDFRQRLLEQGAAPVGNTPEQFASYIQRELTKWEKVIKAANVRPD